MDINSGRSSNNLVKTIMIETQTELQPKTFLGRELIPRDAVTIDWLGSKFNAREIDYRVLGDKYYQRKAVQEDYGHTRYLSGTYTTQTMTARDYYLTCIDNDWDPRKVFNAIYMEP